MDINEQVRRLWAVAGQLQEQIDELVKESESEVLAEIPICSDVNDESDAGELGRDLPAPPFEGFDE